MGPIRRLLPTAFTLGALVGSGLVGTTLTAAPAAAADCDVAVVVDFTDLPNGPGSTRSGCATAPGTGLEALEQAGFAPSMRLTDQGNVVCDIDGAPGTYCAEGGLWTYWVVPPGASDWFALDPASAAGGWTPQPGSVEGWNYQAHPDLPAEPPTVGAPGPTEPTTTPSSEPGTPPSTEPTPPTTTETPTDVPPASGQTVVPPGDTSSGGSSPGGGGAGGGSPSVQPPDLGGPGGGTGTGPGSSNSADSGADGSTSPPESGPPDESDPAATSSNPLSSSGVLGIGGGSPGGREITGPAAVVGLGVDPPLPDASPWVLIICGAVLAGTAAWLARLRHRRLTSDSGGRHS